jgi:hypothetical protein
MNRITLSLGLLFLLVATAYARKPEDAFAGQILISSAPYPTEAKSENAFTDAIKKQSTDRLQEDKENQKWTVFYAAFFSKPLNDLELTIKVFDISQPGAQRLVDTFEQYLSASGQRAYISKMTLKRGDGTSGYDPNSKILMVMESRGKKLAQTTFYLVGEARHYSGKVDMSEDDKESK